MKPFRYTLPQIAIHWLAALLIAFLLISGSAVLANLPNVPAKVGNLRIHMLLGGLAGLLIIARIVLRKRSPLPPPVTGGRLARLGHMALNLVVVLLAVSGMLLMLQSGVLDAVFGNGALPQDFKEFTPRKIHGIASRAAMGLIALHVLAVLYHQIALKDGLLSRMGIGSAQSGR